MTFLAALHTNRIEAPCVIDGLINGTIFLALMTQFLVPTLTPGDIVIMDIGRLWEGHDCGIRGPQASITLEGTEHKP